MPELIVPEESGYLAVHNDKVFTLDDLPGMNVVSMHWTVDYRVERLEWQVTAWSVDHERMFVYWFDPDCSRDRARTLLLELLPILGHDANRRLTGEV